MSETILGVVIGGSITLIGAVVALWGQLKLRRMDIEAEFAVRREERHAGVEDQRQERYGTLPGTILAPPAGH